MKGQINAYDCPCCLKVMVTIDVADGATPAVLNCRKTPGCPGAARSRWYNGCQGLTPEFEWYAPGEVELREQSPATQAHVHDGGLMIRAIRARMNAGW